MRSQHLFVALSSALLCAPALCGEHSRPPTTIRVYKVADLAAYDSVCRSTHRLGIDGCTIEEWQSEYKATLDALDRLGGLLETVVPGEHASVAVHPESLSLVVRHTAEGHSEIADLLEQLRQDDQPRIELIFLRVPDSLVIPDTAAVAGKAIAQSPATGPSSVPDPPSATLTPEQPRRKSRVPESTRRRFDELYGKGVLMLGEAMLAPQELKELLAICAQYAPYPLYERRVRVAIGRRTACRIGEDVLGTTTALVSRDRSHVRLRMDTVYDCMHGDKLPFATQFLTIPEGHAVWVSIPIDGSYRRLLVTTRLIVPKVASRAEQPCCPHDDVQYPVADSRDCP